MYISKNFAHSKSLKSFFHLTIYKYFQLQKCKIHFISDLNSLCLSSYTKIIICSLSCRRMAESSKTIKLFPITVKKFCRFILRWSACACFVFRRQLWRASRVCARRPISQSQCNLLVHGTHSWPGSCCGPCAWCKPPRTDPSDRKRQRTKCCYLEKAKLF